LAATDPPAAPTIEVLTDDYVSVSDATRLFRSGVSPPYYGGHHEPLPNYNFRDPNYYPDAGLGFPILSAHGTRIPRELPPGHDPVALVGGTGREH
jgi:hypothetical protein